MIKILFYLVHPTTLKMIYFYQIRSSLTLILLPPMLWRTKERKNPGTPQCRVHIYSQMADIICSVDPSYKKYVVTEGKDRVLYLSLLKALYGCVQSALLWYKLFSETLWGIGFKINPYDCYVANCDVGGSQCTIVWYIDDIQISRIH